MLLKNTPRREYRLRDGTLVPGVTTVLEILNKPALLAWAWRGGWDSRNKLAESPDWTSYPVNFADWQNTQRDSTAGVGTIAHYKIHCWLTRQKEEYGPGWEEEHIKMADVPFRGFIKYYTYRVFDACYYRPVLTEYSSVHEKLRYGGTLDLLVDTPNGAELWDIKTSKAIYEDNYIQLAAYKMLLAQDPKWRQMKIRERVVLVTKDGRLEAPDVSKAYMDKARATWDRLIKMYHKLNEFRKAA